MQVHRAALVACSVALATSCGSPSEAPQEPDVRGVWAGGRAWFWSQRNEAAPQTWALTQCEGSLEVTEQDGASFAGRYTITCSGGPGSAGRVDGRVGADGVVTFRLQAEQGASPERLPPVVRDLDCPLGSDPGFYEGTVAYGPMTAHRFLRFDCPAGQIQATASFEGRR